MVNQITANLKNAVTNLHVSLPVALAAGLAIAQIWLPKYANELNATAAVLAAYGVIGAANTPLAKQTPPAPKNSTPPTA